VPARVANEVGCRCIITDAYRDRIGRYAKYGFVPIEGASESGPSRCFSTSVLSGRRCDAENANGARRIPSIPQCALALARGNSSRAASHRFHSCLC
jgi:hypothetical protein